MLPKIEYSAFIVNVLVLLINAENDEIHTKLRTIKICGSGNNCNSLSPKELPSKEYLEQLLFTFGSWTNWTPCNSNCSTRRVRYCRFPIICGTTTINEEAFCYQRRTYCEYVYHKNWDQFNVDEEESEGESMDKFHDLLINPNPIPSFHSLMTRRHNNNYPPSNNPALKRNYNNPYDRDTNTNRDQSYRRNFNDNRGSTNTHHHSYTPSPVRNVLYGECGIPKIRDSNPSGRTLRILGGREVEKGRWPWQAAIHNRLGETFCGGTLIAPQWVLTAAHCIKRRISVTIGEHQLEHDDGIEKHFQVDTAFIHPSFDIDTVDNDIALILLPEPVTSDHTMACLPQQNQSLPGIGTYCTILGWGKQRYNHVFGTTVLHEGQVPIVSNSLCRETHGHSDISPNMFCGGFRDGTVDSCQGDSGGPLLCSHQNRWTIFGVTSFGDGCGVKEKYGIYAKVPNYVEWINRVMEAQRNPSHYYYH